MSRAARSGARFFGALVICLCLVPAARSQRIHGGLGIDLEADSDGTGVTIREVYVNGPADRGWLRSGDVIERINDRPAQNRLEYRRIVTRLWVGEVAIVDYRRGKKKRTARVVVDLDPVATGNIQSHD
jgi:S1-C subfamily serine protease